MVNYTAFNYPSSLLLWVDAMGDGDEPNLTASPLGCNHVVGQPAGHGLLLFYRHLQTVLEVAREKGKNV